MFTVSHVTLRGTNRPRLNDVSLTISGRRTAVMGYSGAGKTSLLNLLAGFEIPDSGAIIAGRPDRAERVPAYIYHSMSCWIFIATMRPESTL